MQQDLRHSHNTVETLQENLSSTQFELEHRMDGIARSLVATAKHLQIPAAIMDGLAQLTTQAEAMGQHLNELQQQQSEALHKEIATQRSAMTLELSDLQAQLEDCRHAAGVSLLCIRIAFLNSHRMAQTYRA